jgi:hypothetical protein
MSEILTFPAEKELDIESLRYTGELDSSESHQVLFTIPVRRPDPQIYCRVRPGEGWRIITAALELKGDGARGEIYLVTAPELRSALAAELRKMVLFYCMDRFEKPFIWPIKIEDGRKNSWLSSAMDAAHLAMRSWARIVPDFGLSGYRAHVATANLPEPPWPELTFQEVINLAFKDRQIKDADHEILRRLRGEL